MTTPLFYGSPIHNPVDQGELDRRIIEQIVDERIRQLVQNDGLQNYRVQNLGTDRFDADESSASYPWGISYMSLSSEAASQGWPENGAFTGFIRTEIYARGDGHRIVQTAFPKAFGEANNHIYHRTRNSDDTAWMDWSLTQAAQYAEEDGGSHSIAVASTYETFVTATIDDLPDSDDCNWGAGVQAQSSVWVVDTTNDASTQCRLRISADGGSTWTNGQPNVAYIDTAQSTTRAAMAPMAQVESTAPTGNIVVELQVQSNQTTTVFHDGVIHVSVGPRMVAI